MPGKFSKHDYPIVLILCISLLLAACSPGPASRPTEVAGTPAPANLAISVLPTYTPTPLPLGSTENPLRIGIVLPSPSVESEAALRSLNQAISGMSNFAVQFQPFASYIDMENALQRKLIQMAWTQPVEYLLASEKGLLYAALVTNHLGVTAYGVQFVGNAASNFALYFDAGTNRSTSEAPTALAQFSGLQPCFLSTNSLSGYWVPLGYLKAANVGNQAPVFTYSHSASLRALYITGICDYAATYAISGDPRTSSAVIVDLGDALSQLPVIWISPPVIPNLVLASAPDLDAAILNRVTEALLAFSQTEQGRAELSLGLNYEISGLEAFTDSGFTELRALLAGVNLSLSSLLPAP